MIRTADPGHHRTVDTLGKMFMASALIALVLKAGGREIEAAQSIRAAAPHAHPNRPIVALADDILGLEGPLIAAARGHGPPEPMMHEPLVRLPLLDDRPR